MMFEYNENRHFARFRPNSNRLPQTSQHGKQGLSATPPHTTIPRVLYFPKWQATGPDSWYFAESTMNLRALIPVVLTVALGLLSSHTTLAALPIDIEVAMQPGVPITAPQEWAKQLGKLDLNRVRLRNASDDVRPAIEFKPSTSGQRVKITAILTRNNELVLPKRHFKSHNLSAMRSYFQQLATEGSETDAKRGRFNLTEKQFNTVHSNLAKKVGFATATLTTAEMLARLEQQFTMPVKRSAIAETRLRGAPIGLELQEMSIGTALAMALRQEGLVLRPEKQISKPLELHILPFDPSLEIWPVGWKSDAGKRKLAPQMFDSLTIEIANHTLTDALEALAPRLGVPLILDQWILEQRDIFPSKIDVKFARRKTYIKRAVDSILSQAHLGGELRIDELGNVFYWVSQFGKNSPRAE